MSQLRRLLIVVILCVVAPVSRGRAAGDATLLRVFLADGTPLVSYGEFARVDDRVVFSMPVGGSAAQPELHMVSIPARAVDWLRTEQYGASARYQHYASTRGEQDFTLLSNAVAQVLNDIALTTEPVRALELALQARMAMAGWPASHYGYRQREVMEIVGLLDESIANLRANAGVGAFDLALVAHVSDVELEPVLGLPSPRESLASLMSVARLAPHAADRISLLQSALLVLGRAAPTMPAREVSTLRSSIRAQIGDEQETDVKYARLSAKLMADAQRAASAARIRDVEVVLARVAAEDGRLGRLRPDVVEALQSSLQAHLESARKLQLLRDRWVVRQAVYRDYQRSVSAQLLQLVKSQPALDAIKRLEGPAPNSLFKLYGRLAGGAEQLQRRSPPVELSTVHDTFVSAWRFAEQALQTRQAAVTSGDVATAWQASSSAAAALMLLSNAQGGLRAFLEPPQISGSRPSVASAKRPVPPVRR